VTLCRLSHDFFKYSSLRKMDETELVRMTHKGCRIYWHSPRHHNKAFLEIWKIISSTTSTQGRGIRLRRSLCQRNSLRRGIMDITSIWLVSSAVCFVTLWVVLDLIRVSKDTIAKQSGRGEIK
jgi:hypothetical protein